jgi:hypothetical protein
MDSQRRVFPNPFVPVQRRCFAILLDSPLLSRLEAASWAFQYRTAWRTRRSIAASRQSSWCRRRRSVQSAHPRGAAQGRRSKCTIPAAPHEMKRRSMLCHSVRRAPPPRKASSFHRISLAPQLYSSSLGASARVTAARVTVVSEPAARALHRGELHSGSDRTQAPIGFKGSPLRLAAQFGHRKM